MRIKDKEGIEAIKSFLRTHESSLATEIAKDKGINKVVSYAKVFALLRVMTAKQIVRRVEANGRDVRYTLNDSSLLVSVPEDLVEFRNRFRVLLEASKNKAYSIFGEPQNPRDFGKYLRFIMWPLTIYATLTRIHYLYVILVWPSMIKDSQTLKELNNLAIMSMTDIQTDIREMFDFFEEDITWQIRDLVTFERQFNDILGPQLLFSYLLDFEKDGLDKEAKPVLDTLWSFGLSFFSTMPLFGAKIIDVAQELKINEKDWLTLVKYDHSHLEGLHNSPFINKSRYKTYYTKPDLLPKKPPFKQKPIDDGALKKEFEAFKQITTIPDITKLSDTSAEKYRDQAIADIAKAFEKQKDEMANQILRPEQEFVDSTSKASANMFFALIKLGYSHADALKAVNKEVESHYRNILRGRGVSLMYGAVQIWNPSR